MTSRSIGRASMAAALFASLSVGCYRTTFVNPAVAPGPEETSETSETHVFGFWGLAGSGDIDAREACQGQEVAVVSYYANAGEVLVSFFTLGLLGLRTVAFTCGSRGPGVVSTQGGAR